MFLANPILLTGIFGVALAALLLPWRYGAKSEAMRKAAASSMTALVILGGAWVLLGGIVGLNHMYVHSDCVRTAEMWDEVRAHGPLSEENSALEKEFISTCNTIIARYSGK